MKYPVLIDGGLSNELEKLGCDLNHKLWSAKLLKDNPEALIATHLAYLNAGAQIIATASYQASIKGYIDLGYDPKIAADLILRSVELASTAVTQFIDKNDPIVKPLVAASIGPYGAYLADGSEYRGDYTISDSELRNFHIRRIELLDNSSADLLAFETIPSFQEVMILAEIVRKATKPVWLSFSCKDSVHINDGTPIRKCAEYLNNHPNIFAIGVNCTPPKFITGLIHELKTKTDKKIIVYPNSGEAYNAETKTWLGTADPKMYVQMAREWLDLGADMIGGCCRIGTEHIRMLNTLIIDN